MTLPVLPVVGVLAIFTEIDEIAVKTLSGEYGMKPFVILAVGAGLVYLALTGKADRTFKSVFGKVS